MKVKIIYECDFCDFHSENKTDMERHEAAHYGLTLEDYTEWNRLNQTVKHCSGIYDTCHNSLTETDLDQAVKKLLAFEESHELTDIRCLRHGR